MRKMIFIASNYGRQQWVNDCVAHLSVPYTVLSMDGYELGKIKWIYENTNIDRFIFLQDSMVIKDQAALVSLFDTEGSSCLMCSPACLGCYLGLYERETLSKIEIPIVHTKGDSIYYETRWTAKYIEACEKFSHPLALDSQDFWSVRRHGRDNAVTTNYVYDKYRGDWGQNHHPMSFEPPAPPSNS